MNVGLLIIRCSFQAALRLEIRPSFLYIWHAVSILAHLSDIIIPSEGPGAFFSLLVLVRSFPDRIVPRTTNDMPHPLMRKGVYMDLRR